MSHDLPSRSPTKSPDYDPSLPAVLPVTAESGEHNEVFESISEENRTSNEDGGVNESEPQTNGLAGRTLFELKEEEDQVYDNIIMYVYICGSHR